MSSQVLPAADAIGNVDPSVHAVVELLEVADLGAVHVCVRCDGLDVRESRVTRGTCYSRGSGLRRRSVGEDSRVPGCRGLQKVRSRYPQRRHHVVRSITTGAVGLNMMRSPVTVNTPRVQAISGYQWMPMHRRPRGVMMTGSSSFKSTGPSHAGSSVTGPKVCPPRKVGDRMVISLTSIETFQPLPLVDPRVTSGVSQVVSNNNAPGCLTA